MSGSDSQFVGSIPEHYDTGLGPHIFHDYADDLARRAAATGAGSVLELAAGTGIVSRRLRDALAPTARLVVTDLNAPMLEVAKAKFRDGEAVSFAPANAMELPFETGSFDLLVCQFGVMFFPDRPASYREAARVLRPGGRYLFSTWASIAENPFAGVAHGVAAQVFPDDPPGFYRIPFACDDPEAVKADLAAAGWEDISGHTLTTEKTVTDPEAFARGLVFGNPLIEEIRQRGTIGPEEVMARVVDGLESRFGPAPFRMPLKAFVFSARTPGGS